MGISVFISRLADYHDRHGLLSTIQRFGVALKRTIFANRSVLFYCDLTRLRLGPGRQADSAVERKVAAAELTPEELGTMTSFWNSPLACRNIKERFDRGASLWLIRVDGKLAGYGWTLRGATMEKHYFPIAEDDAHLFDFHVFPEYRGRGLNPLLVINILRNLAGDGVSRAFIEAAEWNASQLASLRNTPFRQLGYATKVILFGRAVVLWVKETERQVTLPERDSGLARLPREGKRRNRLKVTI